MICLLAELIQMRLMTFWPAMDNPSDATKITSRA